MTSRAQKPLLRGINHLTRGHLTSTMACERKENKKGSDDETKYIGGQVLTHFQSLHKRLDLKCTNGLQKPQKKNSDQKN